MKSLSFSVIAAIFFTGGITAAAAETHDVGDIEPYMFEDLINKTIEQLRPMLPDPIKIDIHLFNETFEDDILIGSVDIYNPTLSGLRGFQVPFLKLNPIGMQLNITLAFHIDAYLNYSADAVVLDLLPIYGEGGVGVHVDLELTVSSKMDLLNGTKLKDFFIQIGLPNSTKFFFEGFMYDENASAQISQLLTEIFITPVVTFIDDNQANITETISPIIEDIINELLNGNKTVTEDSFRECSEEFLHDDRLHDLLPDLVTTFSQDQDTSEDISRLISTFVRDFVFEMLSTRKIDAFLGDFKTLENHQGQIDAFLVSLQQKLVDNGAKRLHLP